MTDGNDPASIETLLTHASWVRGLAFSLVRNSADAEDLINETWLKAIQHPPSETGDLRGWFRRVMVHITRQNHRTHTARAAREEKVATSRRPERPDELAERAETLRRLASLVLELPEPYRQAILMRHFEELSADEIAQRLGEPVNTIRTRVKRGYEKLAERLEGEDGPGWKMGLLPLLRWPLVPKAPSPFPPAAPVTRVALRTAILAAAGVAVVVTAALWTSRDTDRGVASAPHAAAPAAGQARNGRHTPAPGDAAAATPAPPLPESSAMPSAAPSRPPAGSVSVTGTIETDAGPPPGTARLHLTALVATRMAKDLETRDLTATGGSVSAELPLVDRLGRRVIEWDVQIDHPDYMPLSTRVRMPFPSHGVTTVRMDPVLLRRAGYVTGSVSFEPAAAGDLATVGTIPNPGDVTYAQPFDTVTAAPGARFRVRALPGKKMIVAAVAANRVPEAREVQVDAGAERDVGVLALAEGVRISGRIGTRPPFPQAKKPMVALLAPRERPFAFPLGERQVGYDGTIAWTYQLFPPVDADGRFTAGGLRPGTFQLTDYATTGVPDPLKSATLKPFEAPTEHADFEYSGTVMRVLVRRGGAPAPGAAVGLGVTTGAVAGDDGVAQFIGAPGATYDAEVMMKGSASVELKIPVPATGEAAPVTVDLPDPAAVPAPATWTVTIRPSSGEVPRIASFGFHTTTGGRVSPYPQHTRDVTIADGVFRMSDIPPGRWRVETRPGCEWSDPAGFLVAVPLEREFASGEHAADEIAASPGGRLVLSAFEADGSRAENVMCRVLDSAQAEVPVSVGILRVGSTQTSAGPRTQLSPFSPTDVYSALPPGTYTVEFEQRAGKAVVQASAKVEVVAGKVAEAVVRFPPR